MATMAKRLLAFSLLLLALLHRATCKVNKDWWRLQTLHHRSYAHAERPERLLTARRTLGRGLSCPAGCNVWGVCNEELGRCDCPRHRTGPACDKTPKNLEDLCDEYGFKSLRACRGELRPHEKGALLCLNSCNGRGTCAGGFCHCIPGFWGPDCSLSMGQDGRVELLAGQGYKPRKTGVKIYVYDLPGNVSTWFNPDVVDRGLHLHFMQRMLSAGVLTANGDEADYYYIPFNSRVGHAFVALQWALPYIQKTWPYWSRDNGHRHILFHLGDMGMNDLPRSFRIDFNQSLSNLTWMTHWGLHTDHVTAGWSAVHRPGKNIVVPALIAGTAGFAMSPLNPANEALRVKRNGTLFFAGRICGDRAAPDPKTGRCSDASLHYSAGVRQRVFEYHHDRKGFKLMVSSPTYTQDISSHKFCLAPTGGGYGKRQVLAIIMGCIPVTITDGVYQPFEPEIDWSKFSVPVPEADIPRLPTILNSINSKKVAELQSQMYCMAQHMYWSSILGGILGEDGRYDAFETLLEILRVRKQHPGVPPEKFTKVDERFRKFVNCDLGDPEPALLCTQAERVANEEVRTCGECRQRSAQILGTVGLSRYAWPGAAACCNETQVAKCPRIWQ